MHILLAEDDLHIATIIQLCLEKIGGHTVICTEDGEAALATALRESFDLILLDGMMPKKNGLQVAQEIRASGLKDTPIIFLSAKSDEKDLIDFLSVGNGYIAKPFDPQTICTHIDKILNSTRSNAG